MKLRTVTVHTQSDACYGGPSRRRWPAAGAVRQGMRLAAQPVRAASAARAASSISGARAADEPELVMRHNYTGMVPVRPELAAELRPLAALAGLADAAALASKVAALGPKPERRVVEHGPRVAEMMLSLGVPRAQLAELLPKCPMLFSRPADDRATILFGQLSRLGLTTAEAARCFGQQPAAAAMPSFEPAIAVLALLFAADSKAGSGKSGEQLLGDFLRKQSAAAGLLCLQPTTLQQRISNLVQRYGPQWKQQNKHAVLVTALQRRSWTLLAQSPGALLALEAVLQQELGQQPGDGTRLLACILQRQARVAGCSRETMRQRVQALVAEFGQERLWQAGPESLAELLAVDSANWQCVLAVWRLLGLADPAALGLRSTRSLTINWLAPDLLARLAALQQLLPWRPSAADAVQQFGGYVANYAPPRLMGRLLFLQQEGALPLLVADKRAAQEQWRQQRHLPATAVDEPPFVSLRDAVKLTDADFCALPAFAQLEAQPEQPGSSSSTTSGSSGSGTSDSSVAQRYSAFMERLPQLPAYQQLLAAGQAESRRLAALLPPELASAVAGGSGA